jgi:bifunctional aspartokinase / homoserine dehydrogenase 2
MSQAAALQGGRQVHKFGGSSLADPSCYRRVAGLIEQQGRGDELIVVSAAGKTTNRLIQLLEAQDAGEHALAAVLTALQTYQQGLLDGLLEGESHQQLSAALQSDLQDITTSLSQAPDHLERHRLLAFGEMWSARLLAALLVERGNAATWLDARRFLLAEEAALARVAIAASRERLQAILAELGNQRVVVTGFIAADAQGRTLLLGRNGSDYSATLLGALAGAEATTIWSDVAGVYSADPRRVKSAHLLERLSLVEANELARLGSPVLHSRTLQPVLDSQQRLALRCSYDADSGSTQILRRKSLVKGARIVTSLDQVVLLELKVLPQQGYAEAIATIEGALAQQQLSALTAHHQPDRKLLRLAYTPETAPNAMTLLLELQQQGLFSGLTLREGYSLLALVGAGVCDHAEQCHRFYRLLADQPLEFIQTNKEGVSLIAVVREITLEPLLLSLHATLFHKTRRVGIVLFGRGNIGSQWLNLYAREKTRLEVEHHLELTLFGVFDSRGGMLEESGLDPLQMVDHFYPESYTMPELLSVLEQHSFDGLILIDLTASEELSGFYPDFGQLGGHLITANKYAGSAPIDFYNRVKQSFADHQRQWRYNATVGAGLPIQNTLLMLSHSGDRIHGVSGIFSGTLSWLFQQYDGSRPFSELVEEAWQHGLTEPDPREDLSGQDVRRKLLILAREAGFALEPEQITLQNLVPTGLRRVSREAFMERLSEMDDTLLDAIEEAQQQGKLLRYVARLERDGRASVGLEALEPHHPFVNLRPCDNIFAIETDWYRSNPLILQGPGAGREVTAAAVQADLWTICAAL